jgi:hypothetical protein
VPAGSPVAGPAALTPQAVIKLVAAASSVMTAKVGLRLLPRRPGG